MYIYVCVCVCVYTNLPYLGFQSTQRKSAENMKQQRCRPTLLITATLLHNFKFHCLIRYLN